MKHDLCWGGSLSQLRYKIGPRRDGRSGIVFDAASVLATTEVTLGLTRPSGKEARAVRTDVSDFKASNSNAFKTDFHARRVSRGALVLRSSSVSRFRTQTRRTRTALLVTEASFAARASTQSCMAFPPSCHRSKASTISRCAGIRDRALQSLAIVQSLMQVIVVQIIS